MELPYGDTPEKSKLHAVSEKPPPLPVTYWNPPPVPNIENAGRARETGTWIAGAASFDEAVRAWALVVGTAGNAK
jgi:hypothetical protein